MDIYVIIVVYLDIFQPSMNYQVISSGGRAFLLVSIMLNARYVSQVGRIRPYQDNMDSTAISDRLIM